MAFGAFRRSMRARSFPFLFLPLRLSGGGGQTARPPPGSGRIPHRTSAFRGIASSPLAIVRPFVLFMSIRGALRRDAHPWPGLNSSMPVSSLSRCAQQTACPGQFVFPAWPPAVVHCHAVGQHSVLPHALLAPPGADRLAGELLCGRAVPQAVFPFTSVPVSSKWTTPSFVSMAFVAARVPPTLEAHRETMAEMVPVESPTPIRLPRSVWMRPALTAP